MQKIINWFDDFLELVAGAIFYLVGMVVVSILFLGALAILFLIGSWMFVG